MRQSLQLRTIVTGTEFPLVFWVHFKNKNTQQQKSPFRFLDNQLPAHFSLQVNKDRALFHTGIWLSTDTGTELNNNRLAK